MSGNSFGSIFRVTTWGESHGPALGVVIDGCPAGLKLTKNDIQKDLDRRKPGQSELSTSRSESDEVKILSGVFENKTTGSPISLIIENNDAKPKDYDKLAEKYRPSHADYTYDAKYGHRDYRGGGRASARETATRVAAGAVAKKLLKRVEILAYVKQIHTISADIDSNKVNAGKVEANIVRCPNTSAAKKMISLIKKIKKSGDSLGGIIECVIRNVPVGLGSPVFDKLEAKLAKAMLSLPASKGFEIGAGFLSASMIGSKHNDYIFEKNGRIFTKTNNAGGVVGGISNGMDIIFRVAFKPTATILKKQKTITRNSKNTHLLFDTTNYRHDPCVLPRAVPIVEAMTALVLADEYLIQKTVRTKP